MRIAAEAANL
jgi:hypothetical protein